MINDENIISNIKSDMSKENIDSINKIEKEIDGCRVRLFFSLENNINVERNVLDNLISVFDRKKQDLSSMQM